ncbi:MAG: tryptophan synthase subunit alpha [Candidatus Neomarinimicrobiota bacterium]|nr:MAG: tryptophan synthase subunit alpha [Candidatus Neomarinimicrobiota bacterium]
MGIHEKFKEVKKEGRIALIVYITFGYPSVGESLDILKLLEDLGVDMIEVGIPFSDPVADGKTIQYASEVALRNGATLRKAIKEIDKLRVNTPIIMMTYYNPVLAYGVDRIFADMKEAGFYGMIVPDLPVEEVAKLKARTTTDGIDFINLVTPVTPDSRVRLIDDVTDGFIYCVSLTGTTGARDRLNPELIPFLKKIQKIVKNPVAVGFGISKPEHIEHIKKYADGVIIGSRIIEAIRSRENLRELIKSYQKALRVENESDSRSSGK